MIIIDEDYTQRLFGNSINCVNMVISATIEVMSEFIIRVVDNSDFDYELPDTTQLENCSDYREWLKETVIEFIISLILPNQDGNEYTEFKIGLSSINDRELVIVGNFLTTLGIDELHEKITTDDFIDLGDIKVLSGYSRDFLGSDDVGNAKLIFNVEMLHNAIISREN